MPVASPSHNHNPCGHKKGEGSSRAFTQSKKPSPSNNRLLLGISFRPAWCSQHNPNSYQLHHRSKAAALGSLRRPKSHAQATIACCLVSLFPKKYAVILSPFYARYQRQATAKTPAGIKRAQDLAELLRRPKSHAQARGACCLVSLFPKKTSRPARADRDVVNSKT